MNIIFPAFSIDKKIEIKSGLLICPEQQSWQTEDWASPAKAPFLTLKTVTPAVPVPILQFLH